MSLFIHWVIKLRDQFSCIGIEAFKALYTNCINARICGIEISPDCHQLLALKNTPHLPVDEDFEDEDPIKCNNIISNTVNDQIAPLSDKSDVFLMTPESNVNGEFLLEIGEWDSIHFIDLQGRDMLNGDWTAVFSNKISKIYPACVLKFNNYWFKKSSSRKINAHYFRASAECKFYNCYKFEFCVDELVTTNTINIQYVVSGSLSFQHSDGETVHARHTSGSLRKIMEKVFSTHLSQIFFITVQLSK
ncbi:hypothetical protein LOD99_10257 [Oopsacas minuta]|uniref:Uncharacterized protein n=1 Tax=Oopsacas minuta TaxID=111878 RepID=A0AAV7KIL3_9METZ|nr:hypothetical protein LOD99_10257 [Oopsacas minuta]